MYCVTIFSLYLTHSLPTCVIEYMDAMYIVLLRFDYRGFMLDVARHFFDKEVIKRQIELLSYYNLNRLHLHLTDDESWSLEIDGIPELTEVSHGLSE